MSADKASNGLSEQDRKVVQDVVREMLPIRALFVMGRFELYLVLVASTLVGIAFDRILTGFWRLVFRLLGI